MREACTMPDDYRVTIRLSPELYAQLEALSRHGAPVAAIVRQALADYLARPPVEPPRGEDPTLSLAAIAASLTDLHRQVQQLTARVDALAASGPPAAAVGRQTAATPPRIRSAGGQYKLTSRQIASLRAKRARGVPIKVLMDEFGISKATLFRYLQ
jgi:hypothetical protein